MKPQLYIDQKITAFANKYKVLAPATDGTKGQLIGLAQQKRLAFKEKVSFYADEKKNTLAFTFRAEKVFDIHGRYIVEDPNGMVIGMFKKEFGASLVSSTWKVFDAGGTELFLVKESNELVAVLRRFGGYVPFVGGIVDLVLQFIKYHFSFQDIRSGQEVGTYMKKTMFRDQYVLSMSDEWFRAVDWRVLAAMSVGLDALQSR